jgi:hypothetical protein
MKLTKINVSKSCTVQAEQFEPVNSFYALEAELAETDDVEKCKKELDDKLQKWVEFAILTWKSPNRAITSGRKLGLFQPVDTPPFKGDEFSNNLK